VNSSSTIRATVKSVQKRDQRQKTKEVIERMNDYAEGVLDAVAWMLTQSTKLTLRKELEEIRDTILKGSARDFKVRLKPKAF